MKADLHCHSLISDGCLSPAEVVTRAHANGVQLLALTDHDTTAGLEAAAGCAAERGLRMVTGVEVSAGWEGGSIHVVGLAVDVLSPVLQQGLQHVRHTRQLRADAMAASLQEVGVPNALAGARAFAENPDVIGRAHFARYLVQCGRGADVSAVFRHYLTPGKPGYVPAEWIGVDEAVRWIVAAGGIAVLAHPAHYRLGKARMERLCALFADAGGRGIEVACGGVTAEQWRESARLARRFALMGSAGSDFHDPAACVADLGQVPALPDDVPAVWQQW